MKIRLRGRLLCRDNAEAAIVEKHLPAHMLASRAETGCLNFSVLRDADNPLVWHVDETFAEPAAFEHHQQRTRQSPWGKATAHIPRAYDISEEPD